MWDYIYSVSFSHDSSYLGTALFLIILFLSLVIVWIIIDAFRYLLKKNKRAKKNKDGGYLRWL